MMHPIRRILQTRNLSLSRMKRRKTQGHFTVRHATSIVPASEYNFTPGELAVLEEYANIEIDNTLNFSIIAHVDHGKSTLADRLLETTQNILPLEDGQEQILDTLQVEKERGITVKAQTASIRYKDPTTGKSWLLNLVDTPGHVDFSYEVARSLAACQGCLLLVDCAQGVQAQTVANYQAARDASLPILPVLTKIDLPTADPEPVLDDMERVLGIDPASVIWTSAKTGEGCDEIFPAIINNLPSPSRISLGRDVPTRALLVDSWYDKYRGVICLIQVIDGSIHVDQTVQLAHTGNSYTVQEIGLLTPKRRPLDSLTGGINYIRGPTDGEGYRVERIQGKDATKWRGTRTPAMGIVGGLVAGQVGYVILGMKTTQQARVGDTILDYNTISEAAGVVKSDGQSKMASEITLPSGRTISSKSVEALPEFKPAVPKIFASIYPVDSMDFGVLKNAVERLLLNDSSVSVTKENSTSLGFGYRCGFLGLLHMDVFHQRLQDEFGMPVIATAPTVPYEIELTDGSIVTVHKPSEFPDPAKVKEYREPMAMARIMTPEDKLPAVLSLLHERRGHQEGLSYLDSSRVLLTYYLPWAEVVSDFYDKLKSVTSGYASFDYEMAGMELTDITKVDILLNQKPVDALSFVTHKEKANTEGRRVVEKLKTLIKRQQFEVVIQAAMSNKIFAKERIPPYRKDVLTKSGKTVGGGDITRKRKLLEKQKKGKGRLKTVGSVELSQEAFLSIMSRNTPKSN